MDEKPHLIGANLDAKPSVHEREIENNKDSLIKYMEYCSTIVTSCVSSVTLRKFVHCNNNTSYI